MKAVASQFDRSETDGLDNPQILQTPEVTAAGGLIAFQDVGNPPDLFREPKTWMFAA